MKILSKCNVVSQIKSWGKDISEKTGEIWRVWNSVNGMYECWFLNFSKHARVSQDVNKENWVKVVWELSALSPKLFCRSKIIQKLDVYLLKPFDIFVNKCSIYHSTQNIFHSCCLWNAHKIKLLVAKFMTRTCLGRADIYKGLWRFCNLIINQVIEKRGFIKQMIKNAKIFIWLLKLN